MLDTAVTALILALFLVVAALFVQGALRFRGTTEGEVTGCDKGHWHANMRREVLWTSIAAALLLGLFAVVR